MDTHDDDTQPVEASAVALIEIEEQAESTVRRQDVNGTMYFSVVDVIALLTDSASPRKYWTAMRNRIHDEGFHEVETLCIQLKMVAPDGKRRSTDAADLETMLRIIQSIPSPKAEPVRQWLAKIGAREIIVATAPTAPTVPAENRPAMPAETAPALDWAAYHRAMVAFYEKTAAIETTLADHTGQIGELDRRVAAAEESLQLVFQQLGPATLSPQQLSTLKALAKRLHEARGTGYQTIYWDLSQDFHVSKYEQIARDEWSAVVTWFTSRIGPTGGLWSEGE